MSPNALHDAELGFWVGSGGPEDGSVGPGNVLVALEVLEMVLMVLGEGEPGMKGSRGSMEMGGGGDPSLSKEPL